MGEILLEYLPFLADPTSQHVLTAIGACALVFSFCLWPSGNSSTDQKPSSGRRVVEKKRVVEAARFALEKAIGKIPEVPRTRREAVDSIKPCIVILKARLRDDQFEIWQEIENACESISSVEATTTVEFRDLTRAVVENLKALHSRLSDDMLK